MPAARAQRANSVPMPGGKYQQYSHSENQYLQFEGEIDLTGSHRVDTLICLDENQT